jgi:hypothetical protein
MGQMTRQAAERPEAMLAATPDTANATTPPGPKSGVTR